MSIEPEIPLLSYANQAMPLPQRLAIRSMEQFSGRGELYRRYQRFQREVKRLEKIPDRWNLAVEILGIHDVQRADLVRPKQQNGRGLLLIANHPYGIADGIMLAWLSSRLCSDFRIIAIGLLCAEPSLNPNILPINFDQSREAIRENVATRRAAVETLRRGGVVAIFPAGAVSWSRVRGQPVEDEEWKAMTGKLINASQCDVLPVYFKGANSGLYQFFSRHLMSLRQGLYLREVRKHLDKTIEFSIGEMILNQDMPKLSDDALAQFLRTHHNSIEPR